MLPTLTMVVKCVFKYSDTYLTHGTLYIHAIYFCQEDLSRVTENTWFCYRNNCLRDSGLKRDPQKARAARESGLLAEVTVEE